MANYTSALCTISGISPYSQSRKHDTAKLKSESAENLDIRTWRNHLHVGRTSGKVVIPTHGMMQALAASAKYSAKQIPGQGKKTWTAKFKSGIAILQEINLGVAPDDCQMISIQAHSNGVRGSGSRVTRRFPIFYDWSTTFEVVILDEIITQDVFEETLENAGMFIGLGRFRPENGGENGRFRLDKLTWTDNRKLAA